MSQHSPSDASLLLYYCPTTGMVLDPETHRYYRRCEGGDLDEEEVYQGHMFNGTAASWYASLQLSELGDGETAPPAGKVGQYGRFGCVLEEGLGGITDSAGDVVLFVYEEDGLPKFLRALKQCTGARFRRCTAYPPDYSSLHSLTTFAFQELDEDEEDAASDTGDELGKRRYVVHFEGDDYELQTDIDAALEWGREHARRLLAPSPE